jgi:hypothetical protein
MNWVAAFLNELFAHLSMTLPGGVIKGGLIGKFICMI